MEGLRPGPGSTASPPLPGKGRRTTAALWVLGGTGGSGAGLRAPREDATLVSQVGSPGRKLSLFTPVAGPARRVQSPPLPLPQLWPWSNPHPAGAALASDEPLRSRGAGQPGLPLLRGEGTKRPWRCRCPWPPPTRDGSMCRAGGCFLLDRRGPGAVVTGALRGASMSTGLHHPSLLRHK